MAQLFSLGVMARVLLQTLLIQVLLIGATGAFGSGVDTNLESQVWKPRASAVSAPRPDYPLEARQRHLTGSGILILHIDKPSGMVTSIDVAKSTGHKILDDAATRAFLRWRFKPGLYTKIKVPIRYTINGSQ